MSRKKLLEQLYQDVLSQRMKSGIADKISSKKTRSFLTEFLLKKFWFFLHEIVYSWIRSTGKEYESVYGVIDNQETKERISYFFSCNVKFIRSEYI